MSVNSNNEDPFLWLEDVDSKKSMDWVNSHNESSLQTLQTEAITLPKNKK